MTAPTFVRNPHALTGTVDGHHVVFNLDDRQLHMLNPTAAAIWNALDHPATVAEISAASAFEYGVDVADISSDVEELVANLVESGLCGTAGEMARFNDRVVAPDWPPPSVVANDDEPTTSTPAGHEGAIHHLGPFSSLRKSVVLSVDDELIRAELDAILDPLRGAPASSNAGHIAIAIRALSAPPSSEPTPFADQTRRAAWSVRTTRGTDQVFTSRARVIRHVVAEINAAPLDYLDDAVVFHASAAEFNTGIAIFPGVSNAGKSTLISQLVLRGHKYVSDEAVLVDTETFQVEPYTKSISIDPGSQHVLESLLPNVQRTGSTIDIDPRSIGPGLLSEGGSISAIIFPQYTSHSETVITPLSAFDAFADLLANAFDFDRVGQAAFDAIVTLANTVPAYRLEHRGTVDHLDQVETIVNATSPTRDSRPLGA